MVFLFEPEVKVTLLIDSPMMFFAGVSMRGGWIIGNVFLLVNDSMQYFFFQKRAQSEGQEGISMNNSMTEEY